MAVRSVRWDTLETSVMCAIKNKHMNWNRDDVWLGYKSINLFGPLVWCSFGL